MGMQGDKSAPSGRVDIYLYRLDGDFRRKPKEVSQKGRALLAYAVKERYGLVTGPEDVGLLEKGKPYFPAWPRIHFNISHSGQYVGLALGDLPVGFDIQEKEQAAFEQMGRHVFSAEEAAAFSRAEDPADFFYRAWVRKEAWIKWSGEGFYRDIKSLPDEGVTRYLDVEAGYYCALHTEVPVETVLRRIEALP